MAGFILTLNRTPVGLKMTQGLPETALLLTVPEHLADEGPKGMTASEEPFPSFKRGKKLHRNDPVEDRFQLTDSAPVKDVGEVVPALAVN
mgnify:CR=1 FL=1